MLDKKYQNHHFHHILKVKQVMLVNVMHMDQVLNQMVLWLINQLGLKLMQQVSLIDIDKFILFIQHFGIDAGNGLAEVILVDPRGRQDVVPVSVKQIGPGKFRCEYVPREPGLHSVNIFFAGRPIPNSPYGVNVASCM
jgi:hypothetical protein